MSVQKRETPAPASLRFARTQSVLARILDSAAVGMAVSAMDGTIAYVNPAFAALLGRTVAGLTNTDILDLIHPEDNAAARLQLARLLRGEAQEYRGEHRFRHADGQPLWVMAAASLLPAGGKGGTPFLITQITSIELQKKAEAALANSESRWNFALESARQGVWDHDIRADTMFYSRMWRVMRGIPPEEEVDGDMERWLERVHPDDVAYIRANVHRQDMGADDFDALEYRERTRDGSYIWIMSRGRPVEWDENGKPIRTLGTDTDITRIKTIEAELQAEKDRLRITLTSIADGVITTDEAGHVLLMNPAAEALTGYGSGEAVGRPASAVFTLCDSTSRAVQPCPVEACLASNDATRLEDDMMLMRRDGALRDIRCTAAPVRGADGRVGGAVLVFQDVTQSRAMQRALAHSASHDDLTGLPNRGAFERALESAVLVARDGSRRHCLLYIDLDRFKPVNDSAGHAAGDELLRQVAQTIRGSCRSHDVAARIGGDEFAVLLHDCPPEHGLGLAGRIVRAISALVFAWGGRSYTIGASVGLTVIGEHPASALGFMGEADAACYAAKAQGRGLAVAFSAL